MYSESKRYDKLYIDNEQEVKNPNLAPLIVSGGSIFRKTAYFLNSILVGPNKGEKEGMIAYKNGEFMGYNGEKWLSFTKEGPWKETDGVLITEGQKIGINKINPKKMLEVGGDVSIDKKLQVKDEVIMESGFQLGENVGKKRRGMVRFWENNFEGFDGENWVKFGNEEREEREIPVLNLESVDKIKLLNCPLTFRSGENETFFYYDWDRSEYRLEKMHKNFSGIKLEDLSIGNLKINGDIIFQEGGRKTIKNLSDPISGNEVATKRYVDQMCSGLQNYIVCDYLILEDEAVINDEDIEPREDIGRPEIGNYIFILTKIRSELVQVEEVIDKIRFKHVSNVLLPAKLCIKSGKYGQSEYIIFNKNSYLQINGMQSFEYMEPLEKNGREIRLKYNENLLNSDLTPRDNSIINSQLTPECITSINLISQCIETKHLQDNIIESRHIGNKIINQAHIQPKSIGDLHLKDGILKNHHFTPGIISEKELGTECIGMTTLKSNIILQKHLTKGCIQGDNIIECQIENRHLCEKIVDGKNLKDKIILSEHLSNYCIKSNHLSNKIIDSIHINEGSIIAEHLQHNIIGKEHLQMNVISGLHLQEDTINSTHLKDRIIMERHLNAKMINEFHILENAIKRKHIEDGCIDSSKISDKILVERHFTNGCITADFIKKNSISGANIAINAIEEKHISNYSIKSSKLVDGCVSDGKIADNSIATSKYKDGSITNDKIKLPFIKIQTDPVFTCTQIVNLGDTLSIGLNQNYMIPKRRDGMVEFMSSVKFGEEGTGQKMQINMEMDITSDVDFKKNIKIGGTKLYEIGEIKSFWNKIKLNESFYKFWTKCDGKRVSRAEYPELAELLGEEEDFYLPDIKTEGLDYYIRVKDL